MAVVVMAVVVMAAVVMAGAITVAVVAILEAMVSGKLTLVTSAAGIMAA